VHKAGFVELSAAIAVATKLNFRAAAAELGMSASGLSHSIAALEARLGVRLFHRTTRSVSLSEAGEAFLARVQPALREITAAMTVANDHRDKPAGTLRINTSEGAAKQVLAPVIAEFLRRYPDMQIDIVTEGRFVDIVADGFDAGIRIAEAVPLDMIAVPIGAPDQRQAVVASPDYLRDRKRPKVPADLKHHQCIRTRLPSGKLYGWEFARLGQAAMINVTGALTVDNHNLMVQAALEGLGVAYLNDWFVREDISAGRLIRLLEDWTQPYPGLRFYYSSHRHAPAGLRAFVDLLRESPQEVTPMKRQHKRATEMAGRNR
jgi:DNA-binding transcriptional LysR family regulator